MTIQARLLFAVFKYTEFIQRQTFSGMTRTLPLLRRSWCQSSTPTVMLMHDASHTLMKRRMIKLLPLQNGIRSIQIGDNQFPLPTPLPMGLRLGAMRFKLRFDPTALLTATFGN